RDVAAGYALGDDLGVDADRVTPDRTLDHREAVVHRVETGLEPGRELDESLTTEPEFHLDRQTGPVGGDARLAGEPDARLDDGPKVLEADRLRLAVARREVPIGDGDFAGVAPGAQFFEAAEDAFETAFGERDGHGALPPGAQNAGL